MNAASDPDLLVGEWAIGALVLVMLGQVFDWFRNTPVAPDPWDKEVESEIQKPDAVEICHHCFAPVSSEGWFCKHCGSATGPYNNLMPFIYVFSQGEVLRNGVNDRLRKSPLIIAGYLLLSLSAYVIFAPVYWIFFFKNLRRPMELDDETVTNLPDHQA
jgi:hypothetical protein